MKLYQHKHNPDRILEAVQLTKSNVDAVAEWCGGLKIEEKDPFTSESYVGVNVPTANGNVRASETSYVVRDSEGNLHVRPEIMFEAKYQLAEAQDEELDFGGPEDSDDDGRNVLTTGDARKELGFSEPASDYAWSSDETSE